jgi:hypothetical protein
MSTTKHADTKQSAGTTALDTPEQQAVTTIVFTGIPMTQAIAEGYAANAKTPAEIAALVPAKMSDFKANISYQIAVRIGVVNTGSVDVPVYEDRYELKLKYATVWDGLLSGLVEFESYVRAGNAYNVQSVTTTVPPTTTIP